MDCVVVLDSWSRSSFFVHYMLCCTKKKQQKTQTTGEINNGLRVPTTERHVEVPERTDSVEVRAASSLLHCYCCSGGEVVHSSVGARMCLCVCVFTVPRETASSPQRLSKSPPRLKQSI